MTKNNFDPNCAKCGKNLREIGEFPLGIKAELLMTVVKSGQRACITCLELALGRRLNRGDFTKQKINRLSRHSYKSAKVINRIERSSNDDQNADNR